MSRAWEEFRRDWRRHVDSGSRRAIPALAVYRFGRWVNDQPAPVAKVGRRLYGVMLLSAEVVSGVFLDCMTEVGEDLHLRRGSDINIHPAAVIGDRVELSHGVTLGVGPHNRAPRLGNDVRVGARATIVGGVTIGDGARVAANSLVLRDVPPGALAIGVPAKIVKNGASAPDPDDGSR